MNNFFENFKRNASDAADKAVKKTNELTAIAKLNVNVKTAESKLSSVYEEIGRLFYNAERTGLDNTGDIADRIMQADKLKADIASCKAEIAKLRKVIVCEGCGEEIADEYAFCPKCGMKQIKPEPEVDIECECCGDENCECEEACECEDEVCDCDCCEASETEETPCCCENEAHEENTDAE